jgi:hypothetical protein
MVGGRHGGGALRVGDNNVGCYHTDSMTVAVLPGANRVSVAIGFMTRDALHIGYPNSECPLPTQSGSSASV